MQCVSLAGQKKQFEDSGKLWLAFFTIYKEKNRLLEPFWKDLEELKARVGQYELKMFMLLFIGYTKLFGRRSL